MYEYHGWGCLSESAHEGDLGGLRHIVPSIQELIGSMTLSVAGVRYVNGTPLLWVAGLSNHPGYDRKSVHDLFRSVAGWAPGSYGLLYERDDDMPPPDGNRFRVWRLARGSFDEVEDSLLSPCVPVIEDSR